MAQPDFEIAMTHLQVGTSRQIAARPDRVIGTARRMLAWKDAPQTCQSCSSAQARYIRQGEALCPSCRDNRSLREGGIEYRARPASQREAPAVDGSQLQGLAIVFDRWSVDLGGFRERIRPPAVDRTLAEGVDLRVLWNHNSDVVLARMSAQTMTATKTDAGLLVRAALPAWASSYYETVKRGDVQGQSFGFSVVDDEWNFDGPVPLRDVHDMRIHETSFVVFPAYPDTTAEARAAEPRRSARWTDTRLRLAR